MNLPELADIQQAYERIQSWVNRTSVLTSSSINSMMGCEMYFKCENFQKVGAFKFRGASNAVISLNEEEASKGVATHSSGNHAAALALAASKRNIPAYIVMPRTSPDIKKRAVAGYGAKITFCEPTLEARESTLEEVVNQTGATFIHPYNNFNVVCGQGTTALEMIEEVPSLDVLITPVGGGGLLSGCSTSAKSLIHGIEVFGAEPRNADDAHRSFRSKRLIPSVNPDTIADGLLTSLGELTFSIIMKRVDDILTVSEAHIVESMRTIWERMKIVVEPSAAVTLGAVLEHPERFRGKRVGIILSGGNVDLGKLPF